MKILVHRDCHCRPFKTRVIRLYFVAPWQKEQQHSGSLAAYTGADRWHQQTHCCSSQVGCWGKHEQVSYTVVAPTVKIVWLIWADAAEKQDLLSASAVWPAMGNHRKELRTPRSLTTLAICTVINDRRWHVLSAVYCHIFQHKLNHMDNGSCW